MIIYQNISFKPFNTLHVNNEIKWLFQIENMQEVFILVYLFHYFHIPYHIIGNASKVLFKNQIVDKPIIMIRNCPEIKNYKNQILVSAATPIRYLIVEMAKKNQGGFENLYAIPASMGGLITMNAGDKLSCIGDFVEKVICLDKNAKLCVIPQKECQFSYRNSCFKNQEYIILYVLLNYQVKDKKMIFNQIRETLKYRIAHQDFLSFTCGSLFKNFEKKSAYQLINDAQANDLEVNDACLSKKHSNFLINRNNATCEDILQLIQSIQKKVYAHSQYQLQLELNILE